MAKVQVSKRVLSVCAVHRHHWILCWSPIFHHALTVLCGVGAFFRTYVSNRGQLHYLRNFAAHKCHFFQIFPNDLSGTPHRIRSQHGRRCSDHFGKILEKMENFFQIIWRDSQWRTLRENAAEILENFWKKTGKNFPKLFPKFFGLDDLTMLGAIIIFSHLVIIFWKKICITT